MWLKHFLITSSLEDFGNLEEFWMPSGIFGYVPVVPTEEKCSSSKGGPAYSKLFRLERSDPFSFRLKFWENFG